MAEETTQTMEPSQSQEVSTPSIENNIGAKLQSSKRGQAISENVAVDKPKTEQVKTEPVKPSAPKDKPTGFDEKQAAWLKSKLPADFDLNNIKHDDPVISTLLKNSMESESAMSKTRTELDTIKNQIKAKEIETVAKNVNPNPKQDPVKTLTKTEEFDNSFQIILDNLLDFNGVSTVAELRQINPASAQRLNDEYVKGRQEAWELEQQRLADEKQKAIDEKTAKERLANEMVQARQFAQTNILNAKKDNPNIESQLVSSGVDAFLNRVESITAWPKDYVLADNDMANFMLKAAVALDKVNRFPELLDNAKQEWEKGRIKQEEAQLPDSEGGMPNAKFNIGSKLQRRNSGGIL